MGDPRSSDGELGAVLAVVRPHPVSVILGCVPGLVLGFVVVTKLGWTGIALLFHPEIELTPGMRPFMWGSIVVTLLVLGLGLRHILDRAEFCQEGFRFLGKAYRYDQIGPISWSHQSQNGLTRFRDCTTMSFRYQGKQIRLRTRYLQDLSYRYHRAYATDPAAGGSSIPPQPGYSNTAHHPR